jgi:hypothetical protein
MNYLEQALQLLYNPKIDPIICGEEANKVKQLNALLKILT